MNSNNPQYLPIDGFSRLSELLPFLPFSKSTLWRWCKDGRFPPPIKISAQVTVWDNKQVHDWINNVKNLNNDLAKPV